MGFLSFFEVCLVRSMRSYPPGVVPTTPDPRARSIDSPPDTPRPECLQTMGSWTPPAPSIPPFTYVLHTAAVCCGASAHSVGRLYVAASLSAQRGGASSGERGSTFSASVEGRG